MEKSPGAGGELLFVLPTYAASQVANATELAAMAAECGFAPIIVCNSLETTTALSDNPFAISAGQNLGYGGAANLVAGKHSFRTIVICNDDMQFSDGAMDALYSTLNNLVSGSATIIGFLPEEKPNIAPLPGVLGVISRVSGFSGVTQRIRERRMRLLARWNDSTSSSFKLSADSISFPFSCVAITAEAWASLTGFDARFPLYFEDMDLLARAYRGETVEIRVILAKCTHPHSASARKSLGYILPLAAIGARNYLILDVGRTRRAAALIVTAGLMVRILCWVPVRRNRRAELSAIIKAIAAAWSTDAVLMPPW